MWVPYTFLLYTSDIFWFIFQSTTAQLNSWYYRPQDFLFLHKSLQQACVGWSWSVLWWPHCLCACSSTGWSNKENRQERKKITFNVLISSIHNMFYLPWKARILITLWFCFIARENYLDYFRKLLHPPSTRCVIPGFTFHAVLHFLHTNLPLPTTVKRVY